MPCCLKYQVGIGEIDIPVASQLDRPNDELPIVDFDPGADTRAMMTCAMAVMGYR